MYRIPLSDPDLDPESAPDHNLLASLLPPPDLVERVRTCILVDKAIKSQTPRRALRHLSPPAQ